MDTPLIVSIIKFLITYATRVILTPHQILNLKILYQFSRLYQLWIFNLMKTEYVKDNLEYRDKVMHYSCGLRQVVIQ